jgi:hypothetical protein
MKVDILAVGVHPDDIELSCSGTLLSHIAQGKSVGLLDLTRGELGTRGNADIRAEKPLKPLASWVLSSGSTWNCLMASCTTLKNTCFAFLK